MTTTTPPPHADAERSEASGALLPTPLNDTPQPSPLTAGLRAAYANRVPGLLLSLFAVAVLLSYWYLPPAQRALQQLSDLKQNTGLLFPFLSTALFGGVFPWLVQRLLPSQRAKATIPALVFMTIFLGLKGIEVEFLYRFLAHYVGNDTSFTTVATKIVFDQFIYCPPWAVPSTFLAFQWQQNGFRITPILTRIRALGVPRWYMRDIFPVLISNLCVWLPAVCVIYQLPLALQLPVMNIVLCFWMLMLVFMTTENNKAAATP